MRRILLIGPSGAGKSTLARRLAEGLGLPLIHLDALYWQPGWVETPKDAWRQTLATRLRGEAWVMDGNYGGTLDLRLAACDTVILLDLPPWQCLWRVVRRRVRHRGIARPDMTPGCPERLDWAFLAWIATWRLRRARNVRRRLADAAQAGVTTHVLRSQAAVDAFVAALPPKR